MRFAFYISGNAGRLRKILKSNEKYLEQVKLIFSDDERNKDLQEEVKCFSDMEYFLHEYNHIGGTDRNLALSDYLLDLLKKKNIDYCFSFGNHILKGRLLEEYQYKIINFHPSLLPMFKGRLAIDQAINSAALLLGCTAHFIDSGIDTGPIIMQSVMSRYVFEQDNYDKILDTQIVMLKKIVGLLNEDKILLQNGKVIIKGADYGRIEYFPYVNDSISK